MGLSRLKCFSCALTDLFKEPLIFLSNLEYLRVRKGTIDKYHQDITCKVGLARENGHILLIKGVVMSLRKIKQVTFLLI